MENRELRNQEKKDLKAHYKKKANRYKGLLQELTIDDLIDGFELNHLTLSDATNLYDDFKPAYFNREFSKCVTEIKNKIEKISKRTFDMQIEYLINNPKENGMFEKFTRDENISIYKQALRDYVDAYGSTQIVNRQ